MINKSKQEILNQILNIESRFELHKLYVENMPIWNVLRYRMRGFFNIEQGLNDITKNGNRKFNINSFKYLLVSLFQFCTLFLTRKRIKYCFVGFTRLEYIDQIYIDKFVDPVIAECKIPKEKYLYFNNESLHPLTRNDEHPIVYTDFIKFFSIIASIVVLPILICRNNYTYCKLITIVKKYVTKNKSALLYLLLKSSSTYVQYRMYKKIFKNIMPQAIVGVSRVTFIPQALAAKQLGIKVIELQHGITQGATMLYSGPYNTNIDPDLFCTFGTSCPLTVFGIDSSKIVEIGWAFKDYIKNKYSSISKIQNSVLVISEPEVSENILRVTLLLAQKYPQINFHLRRHPQEIYNHTQIVSISQYKNVCDVTSKQCSQVAIMAYDFIIGENSSVLFEALSIGKKVAKIDCEGLSVTGYDSTKEDGFFYIHSLDDFPNFLLYSPHIKSNLNIYSDFKASLLVSLMQ